MLKFLEKLSPFSGRHSKHIGVFSFHYAVLFDVDEICEQLHDVGKIKEEKKGD